MVGMGLGSVLLLAAILLIWTASLWKLGGWAGPRGGGSMVAALIVGSIFGSFVGLLLVSVSASRETRRNRAVAIACGSKREPLGVIEPGANVDDVHLESVRLHDHPPRRVASGAGEHSLGRHHRSWA